MRWVKKTGGKLFRLSFSTGRSSRKSQVFRKDPPVGKLSRKKLIRKPDLGFGRKGPFSTDKSDCVRNGLDEDTNPVMRAIGISYIIVFIAMDGTNPNPSSYDTKYTVERVFEYIVVYSGWGGGCCAHLQNVL